MGTCLFKAAREMLGRHQNSECDDGMICQSHLQQIGQDRHKCLGVARQQDHRSDAMQSQRVIPGDGHKPTNTHTQTHHGAIIDLNFCK